MSLSPRRYEGLLERGWRRFGRTLFRPTCRRCSECRSIRIDLRNFQPTIAGIEFLILSNQSDCSTDLVQDAFHDLALLRVDFTDDLQAFISNLKSRFIQLPLVKHLLEQLTHEWTRFGGMRTMIREACGGRDSVSRDDVTKVTQNLYEWVEDLDESGKYEFGVPRHSQLIRLKP